MQIKYNKEYGKVTVTSTIKTEDIKLLKKYNPDALCIKDENGNEIFGVDYSEGHASVAPFGVTFGSTGTDGSAKVVCTLPDVEEDKLKDAIADGVAPVVDGLTKIEAQVADAVLKVRRDRQTLIDSIITE